MRYEYDLPKLHIMYGFHCKRIPSVRPSSSNEVVMKPYRAAVKFGNQYRIFGYSKVEEFSLIEKMKLTPFEIPILVMSQ